jgi:hypothetical protein
VRPDRILHLEFQHRQLQPSWRADRCDVAGQLDGGPSASSNYAGRTTLCVRPTLLARITPRRRRGALSLHDKAASRPKLSAEWEDFMAARTNLRYRTPALRLPKRFRSESIVPRGMQITPPGTQPRTPQCRQASLAGRFPWLQFHTTAAWAEPGRLDSAAQMAASRMGGQFDRARLTSASAILTPRSAPC